MGVHKNVDVHNASISRFQSTPHEVPAGTGSPMPRRCIGKGQGQGSSQWPTPTCNGHSLGECLDGP